MDKQATTNGKGRHQRTGSPPRMALRITSKVSAPGAKVSNIKVVKNGSHANRTKKPYQSNTR